MDKKKSRIIIVLLNVIFKVLEVISARVPKKPAKTVFG